MSDHRGFQNYNSDLDAFSLYHLVQEDTDDAVKASQTGGPVLPALGHALAGALAAALAKATVYPIETIVTRMQVQSQLKGGKEAASAAGSADVEYKSLLDAARKIHRLEGGVRGFYPGIAADVSKGMLDTFLFFFAYTALRKHQVKKDNTKHLSIAKELLVGVVAGCFSKAITTPIQNVVTRQQTAALMAARDPNSTRTPAQSDELSVREVVHQIYSEKGVAGFWSGYSASMLLTLNPSITFAAENALKRLLPHSQREDPSSYVTFLLAACSKVIATSITYPLILAKSRAQASPSSPSGGRDKSTKQRASSVIGAQLAVLLSVRQIYRKEGAAGLYAGLEGELFKGFLQHGLTMSIKEGVHGTVIQTYYALLKLTKRWPEELNVQQAQANVGGAVTEAGERAGNVSASVAEGVKNFGQKLVNGEGLQSAQSMASATVQETGERISNISTTVAEGVKSAAGNLVGNDALSSIRPSTEAVARDAGERVSNVSTTVAEGVKSLGERVVGTENMQAAQANASAAAQEVGERASSVSTTVTEGAKNLAEKAVGGENLKWAQDNASAVTQDAGERASNVSTTIAEGVKSLSGKVADGDTLKSAQGNASAVTGDAAERAGNVAVTVAEGTKSLGKKAAGTEN